jgi:hypothetical protein
MTAASLRKIAAALAEQGFTTPAGRRSSTTSAKPDAWQGGLRSLDHEHVDAEGATLAPVSNMKARRGPPYCNHLVKFF